MTMIISHDFVSGANISSSTRGVSWAARRLKGPKWPCSRGWQWTPAGILPVGWGLETRSSSRHVNGLLGLRLNVVVNLFHSSWVLVMERQNLLGRIKTSVLNTRQPHFCHVLLVQLGFKGRHECCKVGSTGELLKQIDSNTHSHSLSVSLSLALQLSRSPNTSHA